MKTKTFIYLILLYGILGRGLLRAQETFADRYNATHITMQEGLPHNFVDDIYKDSRGFLWISMGGGGLSRYDGYEFMHFSPNTPQHKLKSSFIRRTCEDRFQRLWVVSEGGTDIIDLNTLKAGIPPELFPQLSALANRPASHVMLDAQGCIWLHCGEQIHRIAFNAEGGIQQIQSLSHPDLNKEALALQDIEQNGQVWTCIEGVICKVLPGQDGELVTQPVAGCLHFAPDILVADYIAKENEIWIATNLGLYRYNKNSHAMKQYEHIPGDPGSLSQNYLTGLAVTEDRQLLVTSLRGINIYNPIKDNFDHVYAGTSANGTQLLNSDFINCITLENGHLWIGTEGRGISMLSPKRLSITNYAFDKENPHSLPPNPVNAIYEGPDGTLWVGCVEGGLNRKRPDSNDFMHYTFESGALPHNSVSAITTDSEGTLWVGTWGGGISLLDPKSPNRPKELISSASPGNFPVNFIGALVSDTFNNGVWIGSNQGLYFYDLRTRRLSAPLPEGIAENIRGCIGAIIDREGYLWMGCTTGVYIIDLHSRPDTTHVNTFAYRHLLYKLDDPESRLIEKICCLHEASDGTLWLGSNGHGIYHRTTDAGGNEHFTAYSTEQGLSNNSVRGILEDGEGCLWIATNNGLSCLKQSEEHFTNFTMHDGLPDMQFYWNAACYSPRYGMLFGSMKGLTAIEHDLPTQPLPSPQLRFTHLRINNEEVRPGSGWLEADIAITESITIHEREQSFSLEFAALDFEPNHAATYSYRLLGFNDQWVQLPANRRFASYTNLSPGKYRFQVKYASDNEQEQPRIASLQIVIKPYFYKTPWFIALVVAVAVMTVWQFFRWRVRSLTRQQELLRRQVEERTRELREQTKLLEEKTEELSRQNGLLTERNEKITRQKQQLAQMARKVQELTLDKIAFFTNITHEFRTPITLIIGPIERALKLSYNPQVIEQLHFVERNSKYLLSLVNQLMDFRKVESGKLEICKAEGDFLKFANELIMPFAAPARERNIDIRCFYRLSTTRIYYDEEAMHKVLTNLLSNALKFTPNGGRVSLFIAQLPASVNREESLYICVSDTGSGIPEKDVDRIFNRFYQSQNQMKYPMYGQSGSGIGLYLCKRIVQMLGGEIFARNNRRAGCSLRLLLPLVHEESRPTVPADPARTLPASLEHPAGQEPPAQPEAERQPIRILIVEDNSDMRGYIRSILRDRYELAEAADGAEALQVLERQHIDFIISDLMMPVMDGIELSRRVKENFAISHIPFLMLTAKTSQEARIESYRMGADEYLLKPFDETLLLTRIENILESRKRYQRKFALGMDVEALNMKEESGDKKFINRIMEVMKENYKNSYFEVSDFCEAAGVSKTLLNQKLQSLVGQSAGQFIRNYRLNIARELILKNRENKHMNIAEIAYEVGFNDPKYFTRCFTKEFNIKPSALLNEEGK